MGFEGQARIAEACVVIAGADLACEVAARALAAAGVGRLRLVGLDGAASPPGAGFLAALRASNPELALEVVRLPEGGGDPAGVAAWRERLAGAAALVVEVAGPAGDSLGHAARDLGVPVVSMRSTREGLSVLSSYREPGSSERSTFPPWGTSGEGDPPRPAPAIALDARPAEAPMAVVAGHLAAAEVLVVLAGAASQSASRRGGLVLELPGATSGVNGASTEAERAPPRAGIQPTVVPDERS